MGLGKTVEIRLRERDLAGDARAGSWARARARTRQRGFLRAQWRPFAGFAGLMLVVGIVVCAFTPSPFLKGLILGLVIAAVPGLLWSLILQSTGTAPTMMGDQAEQWTARELRRTRPHGWRLVNHFLLRRDDIDHVLIGPGGVYALETKWSSDRDGRYARDQERAAVTQASSNARSMTLWSELRKRGVEVHPVVVLWGGGIRRWEEEQAIRVLDGVPVLTGPMVGRWVRSLTTGVLDPAALENVWPIIEAQARRRDDHDPAEFAVPMSGGDFVARFGVLLLSACAGFLGLGQVLRITGSVAAAVAFGALALGPALGLLRLGRLRAAAWGWIAGVGLPVVALLVAEALQALS